LRFQISPYEFLNLYGRFCPYNPPHKPGKSISTPFFSFEDENIFQKSARVVPFGIAKYKLEPREPIFEKCSHLRETGAADAFKNDPPFVSKGTVATKP
jgi:hypothetical protein